MAVSFKTAQDQNVSLEKSFIEANIENDIEDFEVYSEMIFWEITGSFYINRIIPKIKQNIHQIIFSHNFVCAFYCSSSRTIVSLKTLFKTIDISKISFDVLLITTEEEVELHPEHGDVEDNGDHH